MNAEATRPNIVLICVDQMRGDCLSSAGHAVVRTPYLDQMFLEGCRFDHAYSGTPSCIAARASLFTGLTQRSHGRVGYQDGVPWNYETTLAGVFTSNGYQTQAIGKMHVYPERSQLGFQNVILHDGYLHHARNHNRYHDTIDDYLPWLRRALGRDADYFDHGLNCNAYTVRPWDKPEHTHPTNFVVTQAIDFLDRRDPRKPFFLFLSFHRPHPPLDPPAWAFEQYMDAEMPEVPVGDWADIWEHLHAPDHPALQAGALSADRLRRARAGYYGHITHIDHQLNRFFEVMAEHAVHHNTYYCFVSDHGDMLGDHHLFRKTVPYEGSSRVPFILRGPSDCGIQRGQVHREIVELRDVMPTLLDCAGLDVPNAVEGKSVLPRARGEEMAWRSHIHGEHTRDGGSLHWVTDGHEKYIWFSGSGREQLFDLDTDPEELADLADLARDAGKAERLTHWRNVLTLELSGREEGFVSGGRLVAGRSVQPCLSHLLNP